MDALPVHLKRYIVDQDYSRYTAVDHATWRHILRQLKSFLSTHAHPCYLGGLERTGIETDRIPSIDSISRHLEAFGWRALPVSGFIPPAAFMEMQSLGVLPIASDMRCVEHASYTPAPDIVHEAAGHAPILVDPNFASYLKSYASVARKAIVSREDLDVYEAIRKLSDIKEQPDATQKQIAQCEAHLKDCERKVSHVSEAAMLGRMNWWTAEYGLIGSLEDPKIYGAGLLSSVGESRSCLQPGVTKIPFSLDCVNFSYDITEPQPQLFVTPSFEQLHEVLEEMAEGMAFRRGGVLGLARAQQAESVTTTELDSGIQISAVLTRVVVTSEGQAIYLKYDGPAQLAEGANELEGQGIARHAHGFSTPVGRPIGFDRPLAHLDPSELEHRGIRVGKRARLEFAEGLVVEGVISGTTRLKKNQLGIITWTDCHVRRGDEVLFEPAWGEYDMAVGEKVVSVFAGPADRRTFGPIDDFPRTIIPRKTWSDRDQKKHALYQAIRDLREAAVPAKPSPTALRALTLELERDFPEEWLARQELEELI